MDGLGEARAALLRIGAADLPQQKEHVGQRQNLLIQKPFVTCGVQLAPLPSSCFVYHQQGCLLDQTRRQFFSSFT
jgi:hypothetical protein